jgi:hypothetical protein
MATWSVEQVEAIAPTPAAMTAARPLVSLTRWSSLGADERAVWGVCRGSGAEPYDTMVDHVGVGFSCTCPSRRRPCKHALGLLLLWVNGQVPNAGAPPPVDSWISSRVARSKDAVGTDPPTGSDAEASSGSDAEASSGSDAVASSGSDAVASSGSDSLAASASSAPDEPAHADDTHVDDTRDDDTRVDDRHADDRHADDTPSDRARDERVERMFAGLVELDRWLDDRMRTGLADPALARYSTWDQLAARLVDAQAGSLANRIRRLAGLVGASADWHGDVLAELGLLHLLSQAARRLGSLPSPTADTVATTVGWQVRQADVLGGVPDTDEWVVAGRSDTREDRIEVRRHWLRGAASGRWALVLSFAAYRQSLDTSLVVGTSLRADLHRYPGPALRALVGLRHGEPVAPARPPAVDLGTACDEIGSMLVVEPWLDRLPVTVRAAVSQTGSAWVLTDDTGSLPVLAGPSMDTLLAVSGGAPVDITVEWTPHGVVPLTIHAPDRSIDIGPRADDSFVSAA